MSHEIKIRPWLLTMVRFGMDSMPISKFKATCLAVLEKVRRTRRPIRVTRFGRPIAEIVPPSIVEGERTWFGKLAGTATIEGDLITPVEVEWEALRK